MKEINKRPSARPMTHDLIKNTIEALGYRVRHVLLVFWEKLEGILKSGKRGNRVWILPAVRELYFSLYVRQEFFRSVSILSALPEILKRRKRTKEISKKSQKGEELEPRSLRKQRELFLSLVLRAFFHHFHPSVLHNLTPFQGKKKKPWTFPRTHKILQNSPPPITNRSPRCVSRLWLATRITPASTTSRGTWASKRPGPTRFVLGHTTCVCENWGVEFWSRIVGNLSGGGGVGGEMFFN